MKKMSKKLERIVIIALSFIFINIYFFGGLWIWIMQDDFGGIFSIIFGEFFLLKLLYLGKWSLKK